jgi:isoquinoline 1-oxidoreductase beta subunit
VAQVVDVAVDAKGAFRVERVVCAVDCGIAINPGIVRAQMEGGTGMALGAVGREAVTLAEDRVEQVNFNTYRSLRIAEMPVIEVHIVPSDAPPSGVGKPGVPPLGPALANTPRRATGKPVRKLLQA